MELGAPEKKPLPDPSAVLSRFASEVPDVGDAVDVKEADRPILGQKRARGGTDGDPVGADRRDVPVILLPDAEILNL